MTWMSAGCLPTADCWYWSQRDDPIKPRPAIWNQYQLISGNSLAAADFLHTERALGFLMSGWINTTCNSLWEFPLDALVHILKTQREGETGNRGFYFYEIWKMIWRSSSQLETSSVFFHQVLNKQTCWFDLSWKSPLSSLSLTNKET